MTKGGFTAVELLVTLSVGVLFLISGYQLYGAVNTRSGNAREMAEASNIGYDVLRKEGSVYHSASGCGSPSSTEVTRTSPNLQNLNITLLRCQPSADTSDLIQVTVKVRYGNDSPQREVIHAVYVTN